LIGALDVQSRESNTFSPDQISILETMADQISISLDSARLYQESIRRLQEIERSRSGALAHEWQDYLYDQRTQRLTVQAGYETTDDYGLRDLAIKTDQTQVGEKTERSTIPFAVPIRLRGMVLGAAQWEIPVAEFTQGKVQLAEELVNRLALTLENARLSSRASEPQNGNVS
jgi:GAF domain-containing protein